MTRIWTRWTEEQIEKLKGLADDGLSSVEIARRMQMSRSKICGQLYRLGINLKVRATPPKVVKAEKRLTSKTKHERKKMSKATVEGLRDVTIKDDEPKPIGPLAAIPDDIDFCRWVNGDPRSKTWRYCGHKTNGGNYCDHHHRRSYVQATLPRNVSPLKATPRPWRSPI